MIDEPETAQSPLDPVPQPPPDPSLRADQAVKAILRGLLDSMEQNETGVLRRRNEECLHNYRIALRRTRSALGQLKQIFPARATERYRARFAQLGAISTPARDFDVYLLKFDELQHALPSAYREALEPLRGVLQQQVEWAYGNLFRHLSSPLHRRFIDTWRQFLEAPPTIRPQAVHALDPIGALAEHRIWRLYRRALKQGHAIKASSPSAQLHELRKTCKKLRYLIEFSRDFYPSEALRHSIKVLRRLQDYLGDFQDLHVQSQTLFDLGLIMRKQSAIPTETLLAMGVLLGNLDQRQTELRREFPKRFKVFATEEHQAEYRQLFHQPPKPRESDLAATSTMDNPA